MTHTVNTNTSDSEASESESRLRQVEVELIRREHRLFVAVMNFARLRREGDESERAASLRAMIWIIFSPQTAAAVGGSIAALVAVANIYLLFKQGELMSESNRMLQSQVIAQKNDTYLTQKKELFPQIDLGPSTQTIESQASILARDDTSPARALVDLADLRDSHAPRDEFNFFNVSLCDYALESVSLTGDKFGSLALRDIIFRNCLLYKVDVHQFSAVNSRFDYSILTACTLLSSPTKPTESLSFNNCRITDSEITLNTPPAPLNNHPPRIIFRNCDLTGTLVMIDEPFEVEFDACRWEEDNPPLDSFGHLLPESENHWKE